MSEGTLLQRFLERAQRHPGREAFRSAFPTPDIATPWSWQRWCDDALAFAETLIAIDVAAGERIAILAGNHPVWPIADVGALLAGTVTVGVYPTSAPPQVAALLADCGARLAVTDTLAQARRIASVRHSLPRLVQILCWEGADLEHDIVGWHEVVHRRSEAEAERCARTTAVTPETLAMLIYTSGSTGEPKGAEITHRYLTASTASIAAVLAWNEEDVTLSFLPFNHAAERITGLWSRVHSGLATVLVADHGRIWEAARAARPTVFGGLPRFYEKLHETMLREQRPAAEVIATQLGGRVRLATSGGAALPREAATALAEGGLAVLGAYGMTEHLCIAFNRPGQPRFDVVGPAMPGTELRIAEDGEVQIRRSDLTFRGYFRRPDATREAFTADGAWLRTGDLGEIDEAGALRIIGRTKEILALSTGKKVAPGPIEARLTEDPFISQAMLVGEGEKYIAALLFVPSATTSSEPGALRARLAGVVDRVNRDLSSSEQVKRFAVIPDELTILAGELTPTLKLRRDAVAARYRGAIEECYS